MYSESIHVFTFTSQSVHHPSSCLQKIYFLVVMNHFFFNKRLGNSADSLRPSAASHFLLFIIALVTSRSSAVLPRISQDCRCFTETRSGGEGTCLGEPGPGVEPPEGPQFLHQRKDQKLLRSWAYECHSWYPLHRHIWHHGCCEVISHFIWAGMTRYHGSSGENELCRILPT